MQITSIRAINNEPAIQAQLNGEGTVLGFDFGEKRIGVSLGEHMLGIAHPLTTINAESNDDRFKQIAELVSEWKPAVLVVGLPLSLDGEEHAVTLLCKKFARRLDGRFSLPVVMIDERLSSVEAGSTLTEMGITGRKQKTMLDKVAAQHILQSYFDRIAQEIQIQENQMRENLHKGQHQ